MPASPLVHLAIPRPTLVVLCGPAGSGKSTFARRHFLPTQIVSSDACRALLADDPSDQTVSGRAFALMHYLLDQRLELGRFTVADSTALTPEARADLRAIARRHDFLTLLLVFATPLEVCVARDAQRPVPVGPEVVRRHWERLQALLEQPGRLARSGFDRVMVLPPEQAERMAVAVTPPRVECDRPGPYDLIGPVEGCAQELRALLARLGYRPQPGGGWRHPEGRTAVFLGDLAGNGPANLEAVRLALAMVRSGAALAVPGDQDVAFARGMAEGGGEGPAAERVHRALQEYAALPPAAQARFRRAFAAWLRKLPPYLLLREGRLAAVHAALPARVQGRISPRVRDLSIYGTVGESGAVADGGGEGWVASYRGRTLVAHAGVEAALPRFYHNTINLHQGCAAGGALTALRVPEMVTIQVQAAARR